MDKVRCRHFGFVGDKLKFKCTTSSRIYLRKVDRSYGATAHLRFVDARHFEHALHLGKVDWRKQPDDKV